MANSSFVFPEGELSDDTVALRPLVAPDEDLYVAALDDAEIHQRMGPLPDTPSSMVATAHEAWRSGTLAVLVITVAGGIAVGVAMVEPGAAQRANVGYWVLADYRGRGYATRALVLASRWALDSLDLARLQLFCELDNRGSQLVAERAGYHREGVLRSYFQFDDHRADAVVYSMVRPESE